MLLLPLRSTRTDTLFPCPTLFPPPRRAASSAGLSRSRCSITTGCHQESQTTPDHAAQGPLRGRRGIRSCRRRQRRQFHRTRPRQPDVDPGCTATAEEPWQQGQLPPVDGRMLDARPPERKSVVWGKGVSVRVNFGGRRIIKKKINKQRKK